MAMVVQAREASPRTPLLIGGGVGVETVTKALGVADAVIVSTALKRVSDWDQAGLSSGWDDAKVMAFLRAAGRT
jgi:predicted TIM-barrel enzyme